jgi:DHA1 family tetracycline resistance protein-like MFS transporter
MYLGYVMYAIGLFLFAFASQSWMMFVFLVPYCLGGFCGPALQSMMSAQVPKNEQGELQGGLTSVMSLASIIGPPLMTNIFSYFTSNNTPVHFAEAAFLLGAVFMLIALLVSYKTLHHNTAIS